MKATGPRNADSEDGAKFQMTPIVDNPTWGGTELRRHDLPYLLSVIGSPAIPSARQDDAAAGPADFSTSATPPLIIHESDTYLVLNKPPDLRMDGPQPATVHKLLTYWYPSPSLVVAAKEKVRRGEFGYLDALLGEVAGLSKHNDLNDNQLRPCHQLDYATSGVLLIARTRKAAAAACEAFQSRRARKEYVAIVHGHIGISVPSPSDGKQNSEHRMLPILKPEQLKCWEDGTEEGQYRKTRTRKGKKTFDGYLPAHSVFGKWQSSITQRQKVDKAIMEDLKRGKDTSMHHRKKKRMNMNQLPINEDKDVCTETVVFESDCVGRNGGHGSEIDDKLLTCSPPLSQEEEQALLSMKWSQVKKNPRWKNLFEDMANRFNTAQKSVGSSSNTQGPTCASSAFKTGATSTQTLEPKTLPHLFRVEGENPNAFYINASIAEIPNDFRMLVDTRALVGHPHRDHYLSFAGDKDLRTFDFKPALSRCVILWRGVFCGRDATKVLLQPRTGRRHQLRLHTVVAGHPIMGDVTYEQPAYKQILGSMEGAAKQLGPGLCSRMCLHAQSLSIPLLGGISGQFVAPDPFTVEDSENGADKSDMAIQQRRK